MKRKNTISLNSIVKFLFLTFLFVVTIIQPTPALGSTNSFGVSGTFSRYHYKLVPGEVIESEDVYVMFFNNYSTEITVEYYTSGPEGVEFQFENAPVKIPAGESVKIPIYLTISEDIVPGSYLIGVAAKVVPDTVSGIVVTGSAQLSARLSVLGEAGSFIIRTVDYQNEAFRSTIRLFRVDDDGTYPVATSETGVLSDRMVPGKYVAYAYYDGAEIGMVEFDLENFDDIEIVMVVQTVFIPVFLVGPVFEDDSSTIRNAQIVYTINNVFRPIPNAKLYLRVWRNNNLLETTEILTFPSLLLGQTQGRYSYIPSRGWQNGSYDFTLEIVDQQDILLATSVNRELVVDQYPFNWIPVLISAVVALSLAILLLLFGKLFNLSAFLLLFKHTKVVAINETLDKKYPSIQEAIDDAKKYNRIIIKKGIHDESIVINKPLQIVGVAYSDSDEAAILKPTKGEAVAVIEILAKEVSIENLIIHSNETTKIAVSIRNSFVQVKGCRIYGFETQLYVKATNHDQRLEKVTIMYNSFNKATEVAIDINDSEVKVLYNQFNRVQTAIKIMNPWKSVVMIKGNKFHDVETEIDADAETKQRLVVQDNNSEKQ